MILHPRAFGWLLGYLLLGSLAFTPSRLMAGPGALPAGSFCLADGQLVRIKAIVAGPKVIQSAKAHEPLAFSFQAVDNAETVRDWKQISNKLK